MMVMMISMTLHVRFAYLYL